MSGEHLEIPAVPEDLLLPVSALARSTSYLSKVIVQLAEGQTLESIIAIDDGQTLATADMVVRRFLRHLEIED